MSYTTTELITGAYYASGVVSREFETVSGTQQHDGLIWLNNIVTETNVADGMIPYETTYNFNAIVGQEKYFIPGLVGIDTLVFYLQDVRFSMRYEKRNAYFGSPRVQNINSLPYEWYFERGMGGGYLYIYFNPDKAYPLELHGYFELPPVMLGQDLSSSVTTANLGVPSVTAAGLITASNLIVNNVDLAGNYATPAALVTYINTGVVPTVTAAIAINDFVLTSRLNPIVVSTLGTESLADNVNFTEFDTTDGALSLRYGAAGFDEFYITFLRYALADRICAEYNYVTPPGVTKQLEYYRGIINKKSKILDLSLSKQSTLQRDRQSFGWCWINLGRGWTR